MVVGGYLYPSPHYLTSPNGYFGIKIGILGCIFNEMLSYYLKYFEVAQSLCA